MVSAWVWKYFRPGIGQEIFSNLIYSTSGLDSLIFGLINLNRTVSDAINGEIEKYKNDYETLSGPIFELVFSVTSFGKEVSESVSSKISTTDVILKTTTSQFSHYMNYVSLGGNVVIAVFSIIVLLFLIGIFLGKL